MTHDRKEGMTADRRSGGVRRRLGLGLLLITSIGTGLVLSSGFTDPQAIGSDQTIGEPSVEETASCCEASSEPAASTTPADFSIATQWLEPAQRSDSASLDLKLTNQEGHTISMRELAGKPLAVAFIYTRCTNTRKCPLTASTMGQLQAKLKEARLDDRVRLVLITLDPKYDTPSLLKAYGQERGLDFNENAMMLRLDHEDLVRFLDRFDVGVSFNRWGVTLHRIELLLFDSDTRYVRSYHTAIWNNERVLGDMQKLVLE